MKRGETVKRRNGESGKERNEREKNERAHRLVLLPLALCPLLSLWFLGCSGLKLPGSIINVPTVQVSGTVLEAQVLEDKPVQGVWVVVNGSVPAFTDAQGRFVVQAPVPTQEQQELRVFLSAAKHGYTAEVEQIQISTKDPTELQQPIYLTSAPGTSSVKGQVVDKITGQGVPDAEVTLMVEAGIALRIHTAADGSFLLSGILEGTRTFKAKAAQYLVAQSTNPVRQGDENANEPINLALLPLGSPATVTGNVVSAETLLPVADATVRIGDKEGKTGAEGNFTIPEAPTGTQTVQVEHPDFERFIDNILIVGEPLLIFLNPPGGNIPPSLPFTIAGKVTLQGETNHSGVRVDVMRKSDGQVIDAVPSTTIEGNYALWVPPGTYLVRASKEGFQTAEQEVTVPSGVAVKDVNFTLLPIP